MAVVKTLNAKEARKTMEQKREDSRRKILDAAMDLFYTKGYSKTTTRDIIRKTGILNGSLYNRFKSKEDILLSVVEDYIKDALKEAGEILETEKNPIISALLPATLELYAASRSVKLADLLYETHKTWRAAEMYARLDTEWMSKNLNKYGIDVLDSPNYDIKLLSLIGAVGNMVGYYARGGKEGYRTMLGLLVNFMSATMGFPVVNVDTVVNRLTEIVESGNIYLCGYRIKDL